MSDPRHDGRRMALFALAIAMTLVACAGGGTTRTTFPPIGSTPQPVGDAAAATRQRLMGVLAPAGFAVREAVAAYRPAEGPLLAAAPRTILEVPLTDDPEPARILIYAFPSPEAAAAAAEDHAAYLRSGTGGINVAPGTEFVIQVVNSTVVYFTWLSAGSPDAGTARIAQALASIGESVPVHP